MTHHMTHHKANDEALAGWLIVALCFVALALTYSARSSIGVLMSIWEQELGWSRTLTSSGSSLVLAVARWRRTPIVDLKTRNSVNQRRHTR